MKKPDSRCCGSGVCIISDAGECWCGQKWDGEKMAYVPLISTSRKMRRCKTKPQTNLNQIIPNFALVFYEGM